MTSTVFLVQWLVIMAFLTCQIGAIIQDCRTLQISNYFSICLIIVFLPAAILSGMSWGDLLFHYLISIAVLALMIPLFIYGILGGGDVKLLVATSIWFNWQDLGGYFFLITLLGGVLAVVVLLVRRFYKNRPVKPLLPWISGDAGLPYGVAIGISAIVLIPKISVLI